MTHSPIGTISPVSSASGMNSPGGTRPRSGSRQRSSASKPRERVALQVHERLVVQLEFLLDERTAQTDLEAAARLHGRVHRRLEEAEGLAPVALGAVEREVGVLEQAVGIVAVVGRQRDADARGDIDLLAGHVIGTTDRLDDGACQPRRAGRLIAIDLDDRELVLAEPGQGIGRVDAAAQPVGNGGEKLVSGRVAERLVDALEIVEVDAEHRQAGFRQRRFKGRLQFLAEEHPVRKIGERVVPRHVGDPRLGAHGLGSRPRAWRRSLRR